jgi:hypothetical protein
MKEREPLKITARRLPLVGLSIIFVGGGIFKRSCLDFSAGADTTAIRRDARNQSEWRRWQALTGLKQAQLSFDIDRPSHGRPDETVRQIAGKLRVRFILGDPQSGNEGRASVDYIRRGTAAN